MYCNEQRLITKEHIAIPHYGLTMCQTIPHYGLTMCQTIPHYDLTMCQTIPHYGLTMCQTIPHYGLTNMPLAGPMTAVVIVTERVI